MTEKWNDKDLEALSAWYDGEASGSVPDPETAEAARLAAYRYVTSAIRDLPQPDVHPAFRTRVMAAIREDAMTAARPTVSLWRWVTAAGAAAAVLILAVAGQALFPGAAPSDPVPASPEPGSSNEHIYHQLATLPESELNALVPADFAPDTEPETSFDAESLEAVQAMGVLVEAQADFGDLLNNLNSEEEARLKRLLIASVWEE